MVKLFFETFVKWILMLLPYMVAAITFLIAGCYLIDTIDRAKKEKVILRRKFK